MEIYEHIRGPGGPNGDVALAGQGLRQFNVACDFCEPVRMCIEGVEVRVWVNLAAHDPNTPCHVRVLVEKETAFEIMPAEDGNVVAGQWPQPGIRDQGSEISEVEIVPGIKGIVG